jgi:hypothetical protein
MKGKKTMNNSYKLIKEFNTEIVTESVLDESGKRKWTISGVTLQSDIKNKNNRIYPKAVLSEAINKHINSYMKTSRALGELNHPDSGMSSINLDRVSHKFVEVKEDNNNFITKAEVLDTPCGKIVQNLLEGGVQLGFSSRGLGNVKNAKDHSLVESLYLVSLGDIVSDPSAPNAFVNGVLESVEFELTESGNFIQKEVFNEMDKYNQIIKKAKPEEINKAVQQIFNEFLTKVK